MNNASESMCDHFERVVFQLDDATGCELDEQERSAIERHLSECPACCQLREDEFRLTQLLRGQESIGAQNKATVSGAPANHWWAVAAAVTGFALILAYHLIDGNSREFSKLGFSNLAPDLHMRTALGSINTRPVLVNAVCKTPTSAALEPSNHIELPAGAAATIDLKGTGTVDVTGPVVMEIDRIGETWKVTLVSGQARVSIASQKSILVAGEFGIVQLEHGVHLVCDVRPVVRALQASFAERENPILQESDESGDQRTVAEMLDEAMTVFSADAENKGADAMRRSAELLGNVVDHPEANPTQKLSAGFYLPSALINSGQFEQALESARSFQAQGSGIGDEIILAIIGDSLWNLGQQDEARETWQQLLEKFPNTGYKPLIQTRLGDSNRPPLDKEPVTPKQMPSEKSGDPETGSKSSPGAITDIQGDIGVLWTVDLDSPSFGAAAVADIDKDGRLEIAFGTYFGDDSVRMLDGETGNQLWRYDAGTACLDASLRFYDLDSDGDLELVVPISNKGQLLALEPDSGKEIWSYQPSPTECTDSPSTIRDLDGDGSPEIVYGTFLGNLHVIDAQNGTGKRIYKVSDEFIQTAPTVADLNKDGTLDFVCATFKGKNNVYAIDGDTGDHLWEFQVPGEHMGMYHGCSVGDLDADGSTELVIAAYDGHVYCLNAADGTQKWDVKPGDSYFMSPTAIADLDGDGRSEVIAAAEKVTVIDAAGKILWSESCAVSGSWDSATRGPSIADLNGDGQLDIATLNGAGGFQVLSGDDGRRLYEFDAAPVAGFSPYHSSHGVTIADLNSDGQLDVFFVVGNSQEPRQGKAICLTGFSGTGSGWYMLRHDPQSTGNLATPIADSLLRHIEKSRD